MVYLPPVETEVAPPVSVSAYQRVVAAIDGLTRGKRSRSWLDCRSPDALLADARSVDKRARNGAVLPLAGVLVAAPDTTNLWRRLTNAGAVLLGTVDSALSGNVVELDLVDAVVAATPPVPGRGLVGLTPTRGLVSALERPTVVAGDIGTAQQVTASVMGSDEIEPQGRVWPSWARVGTGAHPRVLVPAEPDRAVLTERDRRAFTTIIDTLQASRAEVEEIRWSEAIQTWAEHPIVEPGDQDALIIPLTGMRSDLVRLLSDLDVGAVVIHGGVSSGIALLTRAFHDQVAVDLAALLSGAPVGNPLPTNGVDLIAFGAYLRGQPRHDDLAELGIRYMGFAWTAPRYRMLALPGRPMQAGVIEAADGAALLGERWLISPDSLNEFRTQLPDPMMMDTVELADGTRVVGTLCDPETATRGDDVTGFECWRAYLRHLSTQRPVAGTAHD